MENTTPEAIVNRLRLSAQDHFSSARMDAVIELQNLQRHVAEQLAQFKAGNNVTIDWIEDDAKRYHAALIRAEEAGRMLSAAEWAVRTLKEAQS